MTSPALSPSGGADRRTRAAARWSIVVVLSFLLGVAVIAGVRLLLTLEESRALLRDFRKQQSAVSLATSLQRMGVVVAIEGGRIRLRAVDPNDPAKVEEFEFTIAPDTLLIRRDAVVENGVIVGFEAARAGDIADIRSGTRVLVRLVGGPDGRFTPQLLLYGDPFPLF